LCLADLMWRVNAHIAAGGPAAPHPLGQGKTVKDFTTFRLVEPIHDHVIRDMDVCALKDTLETIVWVLHGDLFTSDERGERWFAEMAEMLEQVRPVSFAFGKTNPPRHRCGSAPITLPRTNWRKTS